MTHSRSYRKGVLEEENFPVSEVSEHLDVPDTVVWVDLCAPSADELHELAGELGLHELAVEDALESHQRPKIDHYDTHLFLSCHMVQMGKDGVVVVDEIDAFISERWFVTVRKSEVCELQPITERWDHSANLASYGVPFLLYGLLDVVADSYFGVVDAFDQYYESVSVQLFGDEPLAPSEQRERFQWRQSLVKVHRLVSLLAEAVGSLLRRERNVIPRELEPYYQDVYDHLLRARESADSLRELVSSLVESNLALPRLPPEPGHEESDELGRHHRRAHADHRLLRDERRLPRHQHALGLGGFRRPDHPVLDGPVRAVQAQGLALSAPCPPTRST